MQTWRRPGTTCSSLSTALACRPWPLSCRSARGAPADGSGTWLARPKQRGRGGACLHAHRHWQQFRFGVDGALEWRGAHDNFRQRHSVERSHNGGRHRRRGYRPGLGAQPWRSRVRRIAFHGHSGAPTDGSGTWLARPNQCDCRGARLHPHRQRQQFRFGVGGALEWRGPHDDLCQWHSVERHHSRGRHRRRGDRPGLGAQPWRSRVRRIAFHGHSGNLRRIALTVSQAGTGNASNHRIPAGIELRHMCTARFGRGGTVTLTVKVNGRCSATLQRRCSGTAKMTPLGMMMT